MKIQCSCGAKYAFDVTPEMARNPIRLVCQSCGQDISEPVNELIQQELAKASPVSAPARPAPIRVQAPVPVQPAPSPAAPAAPVATPTVRVSHAAPAVRIAKTPPVEAASPAEAAVERCGKHSAPATEHCRVCNKPICPKCMELFGYVCSPLCKAKADSHGIHVPVFAGQKSVVEARLWRKVGLVAAAVILVGGGTLGLWFWYAWFGSAPKPSFSVRFDQPAYSGHSIICSNDQIVFLHGDMLARYDMKENKQAWSRHLVDMKEIEVEIDADIKATKLAIDKANNDNPDHVPRMPDPEKLRNQLFKSAAASLELRVYGHNIWVSTPGKLVLYDWDTGNPKGNPVNVAFGRATWRGDEMVVMADEGGKQVMTHINLNTCDTRSEEIPTAPPPETAATPAKKGSAPKSGSKTASRTASKSPKNSEMAGLPTTPGGKNSSGPLDPAKVAEKAQHLSTAGKIALPAVLANSANQQRTLDAMDDQPRRPTSSDDSFDPVDSYSLVPTKDGFLQVGVQLLESKMVSRSAMKAAPAKSALEGNVTVAKTAEIANEILNDMQRSRGGDVVVEDESRYQVSVRKPDGKDSWSGEVVGPPHLLPLKTVNVVSANKTLIILSKENKKLWQATLSFNVSGGAGELDEESAPYGQGPVVEHKDGLYVFDQGVLTAFDLSNGNVRWRYPSVGIAGLFFDDKDMLYVNSTTASLDSIKYSRQIDISQKAGSVILKIDSKSGKTLWTSQPGGLINHVSGNYLFCVQSYDPHDEEDDNPYSASTGFETPPYLRIKRINPSNGKEMWEHFQQRAPLDVQIEKNRIQIVFRKEVQVLKFFKF